MPSDDPDVEDISPHIRIRIDPQKKKKWLEYADEHHHGNLTDLIKYAVENTIDDSWVLESRAQNNAEFDTSELEAGLGQMSDRLSVVEKKIDELSLNTTTESKAEFTRDDLIKLANRCHDLLPRLQGPIQFPSLEQSLTVNFANIPNEYRKKIESTSPASFEGAVKASLTGRPEDLATALNEPVHQVRQALTFLEQTESGSTIESIIDDGERRWFIREPDASPEFEFLNDHGTNESLETGDTQTE